MAYEEHYKITDDIISHLNPVIKTIDDGFISSRYVGLVATAAITSYELAIKSIFISFAAKKHDILKVFAESYFKKLNGRIRIDELKENIKRFGKKYVDEFDKKIINAENNSITGKKGSIKESYDNIIGWRHKFVHEGEIPQTATYEETVRAYEIGKQLIKCLEEVMK